MADVARTFFQSDQVDDRSLRHRLLFRLAAYLKPYWAQLLLLLGLMSAGAFIEVLPAEFTQRLIDGYVAKGSLTGAWPLIGAFAFLLVLGMGIQLARWVLLAWVGQRAMLDLRSELFGHLLGRSTHFFHRNPVGRLMTRVTSDVQNLNEMFTSGLVAILGDALSLVAIVLWMVWKHPGLAAVALAIMPLLMVVTEIFRRRAGEAFRETQGRYAAINAYLQEQLSGVSLVQINARETASCEGFALLNQRYLEAFLRTIFAYAVFFPVVEFITTATLAAIIFYAGLRLEAGTLTWGLVLAFIQQSGRFFRPIRELAERYNVMQTAMASSERIFRLLDNTDAVPGPFEPRPLQFRREIRLERLGFSYEEGGRRVLEGIDAEIPRGARIAVVGPTGAGKSTLINLLMRFYDPTEGRITLDGVDFRELALKDLRALYGLVLQDVYIFSGTLEENILLGRARDPARLQAVMLQSRLLDLVERLPEGLRTQVGERGQKLSAGERQLLAFARMLYEEPEILLLDEATSNIDSETEAKIQHVISRVSRRLTTFTVAHRLSTILDADQIWVLDGGRLVERGTHAELVAGGGTYAKLVHLQFGAADSAATP